MRSPSGASMRWIRGATSITLRSSCSSFAPEGGLAFLPEGRDALLAVLGGKAVGEEVVFVGESDLGCGAFRDPDQVLGELHRNRRVARDLSGEGLDARLELIVRNHFLDEPGAMCFGGIDQLAGQQHLQRLAVPDEPRQELRIPGAAVPAELDFTGPEAGRRRGNPDVAVQGDLQAAPDAVASNRR